MNAVSRHSIDTHGGIIEYWSYEIDVSLPLTEQVDELREDLVQIAFPSNGLLVDVGWYPARNPMGNFAVVIVEARNWLHPLYAEEIPDPFSLQDALERACLMASRWNE